MLIQDFTDEYTRYRQIAEKAIAQVSDDGLNEVLARDGNSIAMLMRHVGGNLSSRFTDFLTSDGEKPWRDRDSEFADGRLTRRDAEEIWKRGWSVLESTLSGLRDSDLENTVVTRGLEMTVHSALSRSVTHIAMHVGQIVLIARIVATGEWKWISIPKGQSKEYNANPTLEKRPAT
jgi:hypothetical protein